MTTAIALFTRDLRVTDNPILEAASRFADKVIPLFVLDPRMLSSASPNRRWALGDALADLRHGLRALGADLVVRRGDPANIVAMLAAQHDVTHAHVAADASSWASARERRLAESLGEGIRIEVHDSHGIVPPGAVVPSGGDHYKVFTPYFRSWSMAPRRELAPTPRRLSLPVGIDVGELPGPGQLAGSKRSPHLAQVGEIAALDMAARWLSNGVDHYDEGRDDLAADRTSRLSAALHFGTLSARSLESQLDPDQPGHQAFHRQLCWRDFNLQLLAAFPALGLRDYRDRGDRWRDDRAEVEAWKAGRTGIPIVDAGMRQLLAEGWMHNRARMVVASFLVKTLYIDWRVGAEHFASLLVDADVANNLASWQWVAGTGTDSRPNRVYNPIRQAERYDPKSTYIRRWVPELADVADPKDAREPWRLAGTLQAPDYPEPIVDLSFGRSRFLQARGA